MSDFKWLDTSLRFVSGGGIFKLRLNYETLPKFYEWQRVNVW